MRGPPWVEVIVPNDVLLLMGLDTPRVGEFRVVEQVEVLDPELKV